MIDTDLLLAGAILHDIGKVEELDWERGFCYSDSGQLLGHIIQGLRIVDEKARSVPEFPPKLKTLLDHMLLSHHGELQFGSPKVPLFAEALLLHHLDNLDSKMEAMRSALSKDKQVNGAWSSLVPALDRHVLKKERYLNPSLPESKLAVPATPSPTPGETIAAESIPCEPKPGEPKLPVSAPAGEQPNRQDRPASNSFFAERLKQALGN
jgi:3'-5' exoribonuclease